MKERRSSRMEERREKDIGKRARTVKQRQS